MVEFTITKEDALAELGLSNKEIKVFLALLMIGQSGVSEIARRTKLNRVTTYGILKSLLEKGVVSYFVRNNVRFYEAAHPHQLAAMLDEKRAKLDSIMPQLELIAGSIKERPKTELYEGKEGVKTIMNDILKTKKPAAVIDSTRHLYNLLHYYVPKFIEHRYKAGIHIRVLTERSEETIETLKKKDKKELRETRFIKFTRGIPNAIYIYGNKVAILDLSEHSAHGILIDNENVSKSIRGLFDFIWEFAEK